MEHGVALPRVTEAAQDYRLPEDLFPICEDIADIYGMMEEGEVALWSHDGAADERWPDLATWIDGRGRLHNPRSQADPGLIGFASFGRAAYFAPITRCAARGG